MLKFKISRDQMAIARKEGLTAAQRAVSDEAKPLLSRKRTWSFARWTYTAIFSTFFIATVGPQALIEIKEARDAEAVEQFKARLSRLENVNARRKMTPQERADESFNEYLKLLDRQGTKYDVNSAELQKIKKEKLDMFTRILAAENKNPN